MKRVAVLGGGMAGVIAARYLAAGGPCRVDLYERNDRLGGLHASPLMDGRYYDVGAYAFSARDPVFEAFPGLLEHYVPFRHTFRCVRDDGRIAVVPPGMGQLVRRFGLRGLVRIGTDLLHAKVADRSRSTVPAFCRYYLGRSSTRRGDSGTTSSGSSASRTRTSTFASPRSG